MSKILIIDNYDSFTQNLRHLVYSVSGIDAHIVKNDENVQLIESEYDAVVISPGPGFVGNPADVGLSRDVLEWSHTPVLGVCLGHQLLGHFWGGEVVHSDPICHGTISRIFTVQSPLFKGMPAHFNVVRYHSFEVKNLPSSLRPIAWTEDGVLMAVMHLDRPHFGVQFHPESIDTEAGQHLLANFLSIGGISIGDSVASRHTAHCVDTDRSAITHQTYVYSTDWCVPENVVDVFHAEGRQLIWLDSADSCMEECRFSYLAVRDDTTELWDYDASSRRLKVTMFGGKTESRQVDLFEAMQARIDRIKIAKNDNEFEFSGGFIGVLGYGLGPMNTCKSVPCPSTLMFVTRVIIFDHLEASIHLVEVRQIDDNLEPSAWQIDYENKIRNASIASPVMSLTPYKGHFSFVGKRQYLERVEWCKARLREGQSYQLCLTTEAKLSNVPSAWAFYRELRRSNPAPFAAYLRFEHCEIASSSPELFLTRTRENKLRAKPIKGTRSRGQNPVEDLALSKALARSPKDQAENLMITDLLRHDLGQQAVLGSVCVTGNRLIETFASVHQMVSTIEAHVEPATQSTKILAKSLPAGSMTGAPKKRSVRLLEEIEGRARGFYSGQIGFLSFDQQMKWNVVIRTAVFQQDTMTVGTGGAIVLASDPEEEYEEMLTKLLPVLKPFGFTTREALKQRMNQPGPSDGLPDDRPVERR